MADHKTEKEEGEEGDSYGNKKNKDTADIKVLVDKYFDRKYRSELAALSSVGENIKFLASASFVTQSQTNTDRIKLKPGKNEYEYEVDTIGGDDAYETDDLSGPRKQGCKLSSTECDYPHKTDTVTWHGKVYETRVSFETTKTEAGDKVTIRVYQNVTYVVDVHWITLQYIRCCCEVLGFFHFWGQCWVEYKILDRGVNKQEIPGEPKLISETVYRNIGQEVIDAVIKAIIGSLGDKAKELTKEQLDKLIEELKEKLKR